MLRYRLSLLLLLFFFFFFFSYQMKKAGIFLSSLDITDSVLCLILRLFVVSVVMGFFIC